MKYYTWTSNITHGGTISKYYLRLGWRWMEGRLQFCSEWRREERESGMTGLQKTMEVMKEMMNSICTWLTFTMESVDDFGGKLHCQL